MTNLNDQDKRIALTQAIIRLFDVWKVGLKNQAQLLGYSPKSQNVIRGYRRGTPLANRIDLLDRAEVLLGIQKSLQLLFPNHQELAEGWVNTPNKQYDCRRPLDVMLEGYEGLLAVRSYLEYACNK